MLNQFVLVGTVDSINAIQTISLNVDGTLFEIFMSEKMFEGAAKHWEGCTTGVKGTLQLEPNGAVIIVADKLSLLSAVPEGGSQ